MIGRCFGKVVLWNIVTFSPIDSVHCLGVGIMLYPLAVQQATFPTGLCENYFPSNIITPRPNVSKRTDRQLLLHQPFARTNAFMYSFVPRTVNRYIVR